MSKPVSSPSKREEDSAAVLLTRAASNGDVPAVKALLVSGADVNSANQSGQTALMLAAVMGHAEVVARLIEAGADPQLRDRLGLTALEWSIRRGFSEVSQLLTRISPPLQPTPPAMTASSKADQETTSQPSITPDLNSILSQVPEAIPTTSPASSQEQIQSEHPELASRPSPVEVSRPAPKSPEPAKPVPLDEGISTTSPISEGVKIPEDRGPLQTQPARADISTSPVKSLEPEKPVSVDEGISTTSPISESVKIPADREPLQTQPAPADITTSPVKPPEPEKPVSVDEGISTASPMSGSVEILSDREPLQTQPAPADISTSPVKAPEPLPIDSDSAEKPAAEVTVESKPQVSIDSAQGSTADSLPRAAEPEPQPQVSPLIATSAAAESRDAEREMPSASPSKKANLEMDEDETLNRPRVSVTQRVQTSRKPPSPPISSRPAASPTPLERMPWMADREPSFKASPLAPSATKTSEDSPSVSNLKRCPKCNTVYQNTLMSYCPRDSAALIRTAVLPSVAVTASPPTPIAVWLLIAFVLGASAFAAYRLTQYFYRNDAAAPAAVDTAPAEAPAEAAKPFFTVGGNLAGMEVNVPQPEYPIGLPAGVGPVTVTIRVNKSGRVISAAASSGDRRLRSAAVQAARQATFAADKLAAVNPRSRVVSGSITYEFAPPPAAATSPTPIPTDNTSTTNAPNADPNAPVLSDSLQGAAINVPAAEYPSRQRRAGIGGTITVTIRVNRAGKVISWRTSPGDSQLRAAAISSARKASFSPDKLPGVGEVPGTITYKFTP